MRAFVATLALAGALSFAHAAERGERAGVELAQAGTTAADVLRAKRCAPPLGCRHAGADIAQLVDAIALAEGVPSRLALALVRVESDFRPGLVGRAGEIGLTQIKLATARGLGFRGDRAALFDPATNLTWGLRHARRALDRGSIGFHQAGLYARRASPRYVARVNAAMR